MTKSREQLRQEYINSLDSFIAQNPKVGQLDTARFRDFLIGLVEHESGFNPIAKQGSYFGWYQTNKLDSDPYQQHLNAFNHLNELFRDTISKADVRKARSRGIKDASLMLKYWNQGNRVNNYIWNNKDSADGLGTKISTYGNDLTMPLDIYNYAMDNLSGNYVVRQGDNWFNIQKRVRTPGRDYATAGKDLWNMQRLTGIPYGSLKIGQTFNFGETDSEYDLETAKRVLPKNLINAWQKNPNVNHLPTGYTDDSGKYHYLKSSQHESYPESIEFERKDPKTIRAMSRYGRADDYVSKFPTFSPITSGLPENVLTDQDLVYRPMILKNQYGGLVYSPFLKNKNESASNDEEDVLFDFLNTSPSYPISSVQIYKPIELEKSEAKTKESVQEYTPTETVTTPVAVIQQPISTTDFHQGTLQTPVTRGTIKYGKSNMSLGNLQEFAEMLADEGISFTVTSGLRQNATTKSGNRSRHADGNAIDIVLAEEDFDKFKQKILRSSKLKQYMKDKKVRFLKEYSKSTLGATGGTGKHVHISIGGERFGQNVWGDVFALDDDWFKYIHKLI